MRPAVLVHPDHPDPVEAGGPGCGQQFLGGRDGDVVDGVPAAAQLARHRRDGRLVEHQTPQDEPCAAAGRRRSRPGEPVGVSDEDLADAAVVATPVARHADSQLQGMADDGDVADAPLDAVAVGPGDPAARAAARPLDEQLAPQHGRLVEQSGVGDPHSQLDRADDRVGDDLGRRRRRLRHRVPGELDDIGVGTFIINFPGTVSAQRHDPTTAAGHASPALRIRKSPERAFRSVRR